MSCTYTNLPKNTLRYVNLGKILKILFGEDLEFTLFFVYARHEHYLGSVTILGDLTIHANNFATLNKKNFTSATPLKLALNFLILALNDSAFALVSLSSKKLRILS